jgi:hypothetical protein
MQRSFASGYCSQTEKRFPTPTSMIHLTTPCPSLSAFDTSFANSGGPTPDVCRHEESVGVGTERIEV